MNLESIALNTLLAASSWFNVASVPVQSAPALWKVEQEWTRNEQLRAYEFAASSDLIAGFCHKNPDGFLEFPAIIHAAQYIYLDGRLVFQFGDRSFETFRSFYGAPMVSCSLLEGGQSIRWQAYSYSKYFSRFNFFPRYSPTNLSSNFFQETINVIAAGFLLLMAIINLIIFIGKIPTSLALSFALSNLFFGGFFFFAVASFFGIHIPMLQAHILADSSIFLGVALFFNSLRLRGLISSPVLVLFLSAKLVSLAIFSVARDGDTVQFATTLTFPLALNLVFWSMVPLLNNLREGRLSRGGMLQCISLGCFVASIVNDILLVVGIADTYPLLAVGTVGALVFASLSLNEHLIFTYTERDYLRQNLELEVERKTFELRRKSFELEKAMGDLKYTQAELVQSAKLASLGTLSAGIAHEINNSLNYVNGAIQPLETLIGKEETGLSGQKMKNLLKVMKEGLKTTFEIMDSLRNYSGLNQAKFKDLNVRELIDSVLVIVKTKIPDNVRLTVDIPYDIIVFGSGVGLNQTFMNLIVNAIDAMPGGGELRIWSVAKDGYVELCFSDTGIGMSQQVLDRAFEPFFTTKEVGRGTGLGLHIVRQEIERHKGRIRIDSQLNYGTTVTLSLASQAVARVEGMAA